MSWALPSPLTKPRRAFDKERPQAVATSFRQEKAIIGRPVGLVMLYVCRNTGSTWVRKGPADPPARATGIAASLSTSKGGSKTMRGCVNETQTSSGKNITLAVNVFQGRKFKLFKNGRVFFVFFRMCLI
jgi:hypothetical protein